MHSKSGHKFSMLCASFPPTAGHFESILCLGLGKFKSSLLVSIRYFKMSSQSPLSRGQPRDSPILHDVLVRLSKDQLKRRCVRYGLRSVGKKNLLVSRIMSYLHSRNNQEVKAPQTTNQSQRYQDKQLTHSQSRNSEL